jgi:pimeloyl-ACP methyl ester carboxylesterase
MPQASSNGLQLEYQTIGPSSGRPLLLVRGLGSQLIHWDPAFCSALVAAGHFVVTFDNRDVGLSTHLDSAGAPDLPALSRGETQAAYSLDDMAADTIGLMDSLGIQSAHLVGMSMGGMIAQLAGLRHPSRVRSLTSIMSSPGGSDLPPPTPEAWHAITKSAPPEREAYVSNYLSKKRVVGSPGFDWDEQSTAELAGRAFDRAFNPEGKARQLAAILSAPERRSALADLHSPALVIHGRADQVIPVEHGEATAQAIGGAELKLIDGMGHDLPTGAQSRIVEAIRSHTARA